MADRDRMAAPSETGQGRTLGATEFSQDLRKEFRHGLKSTLVTHAFRKEVRGLAADVRARLPTATPETARFTARMRFERRKAEKAAIKLRKKRRPQREVWSKGRE